MNDDITIDDPFREARRERGVVEAEFQGEMVPMILRHEDVRKAAKDWQTYSSDAPFRVPIPSEEEVRSMRQIPVEVDPPEHKEYRALVETFFARMKNAPQMAAVQALVDRLLDEALARDTTEVVQEFSLPLQSRALAVLLGVPAEEAETWIGWGIHVFKVGDGQEKGEALERYLHAQFDKAEASPGEDFYSLLGKATFQGRPLTREEKMGYANLTFAGGRDTVIHSISCVIGYLGKRPEALDFLRADPARIIHASEEIFRVVSPLTHIGRVCPVETDVHGVKAAPGARVSLCWHSANMDEAAFDHPEEVRLDRRPNPHVAFGFGTHFCLGAIHARAVVRTLMQRLCERVERIEILEAQDHVEAEASYSRTVAYDRLVVRMLGR